MTDDEKAGHMNNSKGSFSDLVVLDMTRYLPGAYATQLLADLGAEVIKVEDTKKGDFCRYDFPTINGVSYYFTALCRNKKSISLDLKNPEANEAFLKLAATADIIVESFWASTTSPSRRSTRGSSTAPTLPSARVTPGA